MVNRCMNPACPTEFRLLTSGNLYAVDRPRMNMEFLWLCCACAAQLTPHLDAAGAVALRRAQATPTAEAPLSSDLCASLRLVANGSQRLPWRHSVPASTHPAVLLHRGSGGPTYNAHR
jgi:hypothetical protein